MPKRIEIDDEVLAKVESQCPKYLSPTGFINLLIDKALTEVPKLPAYRVGAGTVGNFGTKVQPPNEVRGLKPSLPSSPVEPVQPSNDGVGVGRESEGTPRRGGTRRKAENPAEEPFFPSTDDDFRPPVVNRDYSALLPAKEELFEFWSAKGGMITLRAWKGLLRECEKIRADAAGGMAVLKEEITKAAERGQQGIEYSRWMAFGVNRFAKGATPAQPEVRHPAARVFQGGRFVDEDGPTTNPVLKELF